MSLHDKFAQRGLRLDPEIERLYPQQEEALEWIGQNANVPYLLLNAPTGSGKTLILATHAVERGLPWTYGVHTVRLQHQVNKTFAGSVPVLTGRSWHACEIGDENGEACTAAQGQCAVGEYCVWTGQPPRGSARTDENLAWWDSHRNDDGIAARCAYYAQRGDALDSPQRIANYNVILTMPKVLERTDILLADEAHNIEDVVAGAITFEITRKQVERYGLGQVEASWKWAQQAMGTLGEKGSFEPPRVRYEKGQLLGFLERYSTNTKGWLVTATKTGTLFEPVWGTDYVRSSLLHDTHQVVLTSATLMGPEYIAQVLGLPEGTWKYLDLPSTFPAERRRITYRPIAGMNAEALRSGHNDVRSEMQVAIDEIIEYQLAKGNRAGLIHAVSNNYRDKILTESAFCEILVSDETVHSARVERGETSVLVSANITEGWDGKDDLCRFIVFPKVPYPNLGDRRVAARMKDDPRSFDHRALTSVIQGTGRGMRHKEDRCETFILDANWGRLYRQRKEWLPKSFVEAYREERR